MTIDWENFSDLPKETQKRILKKISRLRELSLKELKEEEANALRKGDDETLELIRIQMRDRNQEEDDIYEILGEEEKKEKGPEEKKERKPRGWKRKK